jgi:hypothetical protein
MSPSRSDDKWDLKLYRQVFTFLSFFRVSCLVVLYGMSSLSFSFRHSLCFMRVSSVRYSPLSHCQDYYFEAVMRPLDCTALSSQLNWVSSSVLWPLQGLAGPVAQFRQRMAVHSRSWLIWHISFVLFGLVMSLTNAGENRLLICLDWMVKIQFPLI